jgi:hypothetical protein
MYFSFHSFHDLLTFSIFNLYSILWNDVNVKILTINYTTRFSSVDTFITGDWA